MCKRHHQASKEPSKSCFLGRWKWASSTIWHQQSFKNDLRLHPYFENSNEINKSSEDVFAVSKDPSQYFDGKRVYIQGSLWNGFANVRGGFTNGPYEIWNPEAFFMNDFIAMDSILRLVLSGWLSHILLEQQCLKKVGRFCCLSNFLMGTRKKFQTPYGNNINTSLFKGKRKCWSDWTLWNPKASWWFLFRGKSKISLAILDAYFFFLLWWPNLKWSSSLTG